MNQWVEIQFDCMPLRSVGRLDVPIDASPKFRERCERVRAALDEHGSLNSYYLYNARCVYHLTNDAEFGMIEFQFEGTVLTDADDRKCQQTHLETTLIRETCEWLSAPIVDWFTETVSYSVAVEFDRYIAAGDLEQTRQRIEKLRQESDEAGGFVGMYL